MPLYFDQFRTAEGSLIVDRVGSEHDTDEGAVHEAAEGASEMTRSSHPAIIGGAFKVHDDGGWLIGRVPVARH